MMERKKSQGPSHTVVAASAVVLCVVLVGAAYWFRVDAGPTAGPSTLATSRLHALLTAAKKGPPGYRRWTYANPLHDQDASGLHDRSH